ncbi:MAG TPA: PrsW family glutamic-type intramembrane protease, partial [Rhodanobacter sp.]|nr:PrsW family glutamic-type intramembrane protease [Rhodanobacter sp.]
MIDASWLVHAAIGLLPALCFLAGLLLLDSYKLVHLRMVLAMIVVGGVVAGICYVLNTFLLDTTGLAFATYSRNIAPIIEESLKAAVVIVLIRTRRIGFLVDASVLGFAVGAGFATVENLYYLGQLAGQQTGTWIVRGFGTAILHGGIQAIFAALVLSNVDAQGKLGPRAVLPPLVLIILVHAAF